MAFRDQSDEALVHRVRSGEREVFGVLVDRYKRGIANFIGATVRNPAETADLSQETFLRAYAHLNTFNPQLGKFSTWIYQIARNVVRTHLAKSQRAPQLQELPAEQTLETALADSSPQSDPAGGLLRREAERELRAALAELPERTRNVLALRYFDNMEYQTIASTLGLSLGNVKTLIHRGKIALTKKMREREAHAPRIAGNGRGRREGRMRCSSFEPLLDAYLEGMLERAPVARSRPSPPPLHAPANRCCTNCASSTRLLTTASAPAQRRDRSLPRRSFRKPRQTRAARRETLSALGAALGYLAAAWALLGFARFARQRVQRILQGPGRAERAQPPCRWRRPARHLSRKLALGRGRERRAAARRRSCSAQSSSAIAGCARCWPSTSPRSPRS